jgi:hypothetical protein
MLKKKCILFFIDVYNCNILFLYALSTPFYLTSKKKYVYYFL